MDGAEIASLKWLADVIKTIAATLLGDKLKPMTSEKRAWTFGRNLWVRLKDLEDESMAFVITLKAMNADAAAFQTINPAAQALADEEEKGLAQANADDMIGRLLRSRAISEERIEDYREHVDSRASLEGVDFTHPRGWASLLSYEINRLVFVLAGVSFHLEEINPQLSIFEPEVHNLISMAAMARGQTVHAAEQALVDFLHSESPTDQFAGVLQEAEKSTAAITEAVERMRAFLANEFSFKESF